MGRGIAYVFSAHGFQVEVVDEKKDAIDSAKHFIDRLFQKEVEKGTWNEEVVEEAKNRIHYTTNLEVAVEKSDLVVEAVPEKMEIKKAVFEKLDRFSPSHCILATNTSTMSPTEIASYTKRPEKVIAMHFFNPVPKMKLVEIAPGLLTSDDTVERVKEIVYAIQKEPVVVKEFPGFVTTRISALIGNEAFYMLQEGLASPEEIDRAIKLGLNFPMGPFELGDLVGLDTRLNNLEYLHKTLGEKYRPAPLLVQYVKSGRLGRKTGQGVYDYRKKEDNK